MANEQARGDLVLVRTARGQDAAFDGIDLPESQRRLLMLINGYTPLDDLVARLDLAEDWFGATDELLDRGLVSIEKNVKSTRQAYLNFVVARSSVGEEAALLPSDAERYQGSEQRDAFDGVDG